MYEVQMTQSEEQEAALSPTWGEQRKPSVESECSLCRKALVWTVTEGENAMSKQQKHLVRAPRLTAM